MSAPLTLDSSGARADRSARSIAPDLRWTIYVLPGLLLALGCLYAIRYCSSAPDISGHTLGTDDAYISYRYARNLVQGHGLVFNPGERVEGYTNLLYVLLMTVPLRLGWDVYAFSMAVNFVAIAAALGVFTAHLRSRLGSRPALLGAVLFALAPSLWIWTSSGLETPVVLFLQVSVWVLVEAIEVRPTARYVALLCAANAVLVLTRADGFVTAAIASGYLFAKGRRRYAGVAAAAAGAVLTVLLVWRLGYYHDLWPNTYYAKVCSTLAVRLKSATRELVGVVARQGLFVWFLVIPFGWYVALRSPPRGLAHARRQLRFDLVFPVLWVAYWVWAGGDVFEDRLLLPVIPMGISVLLRAAQVLPSAAWPLVTAVAIAAPLAPIVREDRYGKTAAPKYDRWVALGRFLSERRPGRLLATSAAGKVPFYSDLPTIDMLGLNDHFIAHESAHSFAVGHSKYDPDYVLARHPDIVAAWLSGDGLDCDSGMTYDKYTRAGYRPRFLVNSASRSVAGHDILDVQACSPDQVNLLVHAGWRFGVLERASLSEPPAACPGIPGAGEVHDD